MRVEWTLMCESVTIRRDGTVDVRGLGSDKLTVLRLPATAVFLGLLAFPPDRVTHTVEIEAFDPDMVSVGTQIYRFTPGPLHPEHPPGWEMHQYVPISLNLKSPRTGVHTVRLRCEEAVESVNFLLSVDLKPLNRRHPERT
jgi:hypothetical protein